MARKSKNTEENQIFEGEVFDQLNKNQWRYITCMLENPHFTQKECAEHLGLKAPTISGWPPFVKEALQRARINSHEAVIAMRKQAVAKAMQVKLALLDSDDEKIRSQVASEIIEWELGKAIARQEVTGADGGPIVVKGYQAFDPDMWHDDETAD